MVVLTSCSLAWARAADDGIETAARGFQLVRASLAREPIGRVAANALGLGLGDDPKLAPCDTAAT
jgi:hypothetical protein